MYTNEIKQLATWVEQRYGLQNVSIYPMQSETGKQIYRISPVDGKHLILRKYSLNEINQTASALVNLLQFLEYKNYPAERLIRTIDNAAIDTYSDQQIIITTFIEGVSIDYSPATLYELGAVLGKLHALNSIEADPISLSIAPAQMRVAPELAYATKQLTNITYLVPRELIKRYDILLEVLQNINPCEDLPQVIIHNDCHPANSILTSSGKTILIDWEGAGSGPAILDIGFLLVSCDATPPWIPSNNSKVFNLEVERINAVIDGYHQYHRLNTTELDHLLDAIRFRSIVFGACSFASKIARGEEIEVRWWEARYKASEAIAEVARKHFTTYYL